MKKGFTLIEVLVAISITVMFSAFSLAGISQYIKINNDIIIKTCVLNIMSFINDAKQYCREKNKPGYILFDVKANRVDFYSENKKIEGFNLTSKICLEQVRTKYSRIEIERDGTTASAGGIILRDMYGDPHKITVRIGTGYVEIK